MPGTFAPIGFFCFNRPDHAAKTLAALAANPEARASDLHVFVDGPRHDRDTGAVTRMRLLAAEIRGFASVTVHARVENQGLYAAITSGVGELMRKHGRVIVVEDDVLVSSHFLAYMNQGLDQFQDDPRVGSIHGYCPDLPDLPEYFFLRGADCWGWASWANRWALFQPDARALLRSLEHQGLVDEFCRSHGYRSLKLLCDRAAGKNQSWAILWHASLFLAGAHTLHPGRSFVTNIGNDGSGVHAKTTSAHDARLRSEFSGIPGLVSAQDHSAARSLRTLLDGGQGPWPLRVARQLAVRWQALWALRTARRG
jgi:hypothetical protein